VFVCGVALRLPGGVKSTADLWAALQQPHDLLTTLAHPQTSSSPPPPSHAPSVAAATSSAEHASEPHVDSKKSDSNREGKGNVGEGDYILRKGVVSHLGACAAFDPSSSSSNIKEEANRVSSDVAETPPSWAKRLPVPHSSGMSAEQRGLS